MEKFTWGKIICCLECSMSLPKTNTLKLAQKVHTRKLSCQCPDNGNGFSEDQLCCTSWCSQNGETILMPGLWEQLLSEQYITRFHLTAHSTERPLRTMAYFNIKIFTWWRTHINAWNVETASFITAALLSFRTFTHVSVPRPKKNEFAEQDKSLITFCHSQPSPQCQHLQHVLCTESESLEENFHSMSKLMWRSPQLLKELHIVSKTKICFIQSAWHQVEITFHMMSCPPKKPLRTVHANTRIFLLVTTDSL